MPGFALPKFSNWFLAAAAIGFSAATPTSAAADDPFAGFPEINVLHPGQRSFDVITSDMPQGLLRPAWTRAMSDVGAWPVMFRFQNDIYLEFNRVNGHLG